MATTGVGVKAAARAAFAAWAATIASPALALGLGDIEMQSFLNEPLRAEVALLDTRQLTVDDIRIRLAAVEDFDRLGVDRNYFLTSIEFEISVDEATGRGVILLTTPEAVLEPFLDIIIEARWPQGRLLREYTVLVDPPAFRKEVLTVSATERLQAAAPDKPAVAPAANDPPAAESQGGVERGDRVALRESSLAAGQMPERAFSAETTSQPRPGSRYMVKRDETLWEIASSGRPDGVSVQQAMLDIQRINPEAFIGGNINRVKAGYIIYLPAAGEVDSADLATALEQVRAQNLAYREGRAGPGITAAATLRVSADPLPADTAPSGELPALVPDDSSMAADDADAPAVADAGAPVAGAPAEETPSAAENELAAQLAAMSERLDTLEQIVALKDQQIATLEEALREAREAAAAAPQVVPPATTQPAAPVAPPQRTAPPPAAPIPWLPIGGGILVLLLASAALFLRKRRGAESAVDDRTASVIEDDVFEGVSLKSDALTDLADDDDDVPAPVAATPTAPEDVRSLEDDVGDSGDAPTDEEDAARAPDSPDPHDAGGSRGYGERKHDDYIDEGATGDALAEADIYIAYGRYLQAIELLNTAIESEPENTAYRLKLTELYVDMGEDERAAEQLLALRVQGDEDAIERAEALLGSGAAVAADSAAPADSVTPGTSSDDAPPEEPGLELDLDDDLRDLVDGTQAAASDRPPTSGEDDAPGAAAPGLAADLDLAGADGLNDVEKATVASASQAAIADLEDAFDESNIEFEHLEIEDDLVDGGLDDTPISLEDPEEVLDLTDALSEFSNATIDGERDGDSGNGEDLLIADDADQMATKLDLARAYIDMGDSEGARGILEEIAAAGTGAQQQEARELLSRIG
ncbi:MAG: FimV/HubP family polar landmark protein [Pseudomonadota bacterium]